jgi:hypothetical protein
MRDGYKIVDDARTLRRLERLKLIAEPREALRPSKNGVACRWGKHTYCYVNDVPGGLTTSGWTDLDGHKFKLKYFDGCFFPFVVERIPDA